MKFIKPFTLVLMAVSACFSVWTVSIGKPTSVGAFIFFAAWLVAPYVILSAALIFPSPKSGLSFHWFLAALVTIAGILMLSDVMFWHKDAQGAIAILLVPLFQGVAYAVLLPLALWVSRNRA